MDLEEKFDEDSQNPLEIMMTIIPTVYQSFASTLLISLAYVNMRQKSYLFQFLIDMLLIVVPLILNVTLFANLNNYMQHIIFFTICLLTVLINNNIFKKTDKYLVNFKINKPRHFVTNVRATVNLITVVVILAVDFHENFPIRFRKTEYNGYSLMDVGVGFYVFINGIVAPELYKPINSVSKSVVGSIPIILLGLMRLISVTITGYNVNITEYGLHWNFFMTLAATKIVSSIILNLIGPKHSLLISVITLTIHESLLQSGLADWVFDEDVPRDNLISANREGIISVLGYVGLYFMSISIGKVMNSRYNTNINTITLFTYMIGNTILLAVLTAIFDKYFIVSRRLASTGYCLWIAFIGNVMGLLYAITEIMLSKIYHFLSIKHQIFVPLIFEAINYNALFFFLFANALTGLVNILIIDHQEKMIPTLIILFIYMIVNCSVVTFMYLYKIKLTIYIIGIMFCMQFLFIYYKFVYK